MQVYLVYWFLIRIIEWVPILHHCQKYVILGISYPNSVESGNQNGKNLVSMMDKEFSSLTFVVLSVFL